MKYYKSSLGGPIIPVDPADPEPENSMEVSRDDYEREQADQQDQMPFEQLSWEVKRRLSYPPFTDYLDGVVKGDQAQIDAYIAACQAVKAQYPKT